MDVNQDLEGEKMKQKADIILIDPLLNTRLDLGRPN